MPATDMLERLKDNLADNRIEIDGEVYHVVEGDLLVDEDQLGLYAEQRALLEAEAQVKRQLAALGAPRLALENQGALVGIMQGGKLVRWQPGLVLTYAVLRQTFGNEMEYQLASRSMQEATQAWEETCGIRFSHSSQFDNSNGTQVADVVFTVRKIDAGGRFIASAFFPNDPPPRRRVFLDPSFFANDLPFDRTGVLRHELGHVLGFRHEHIRSGAPPVCPREDLGETIDLTKYDPRSVMHYFCGGVGTRELRITDLDRAGAQQLYGPPLQDHEAFAFVA